MTASSSTTAGRGRSGGVPAAAVGSTPRPSARLSVTDGTGSITLGGISLAVNRPREVISTLDGGTAAR